MRLQKKKKEEEISDFEALEEKDKTAKAQNFSVFVFCSYGAVSLFSCK